MVYKHLGSEETSCWSFRRGMLSHPGLMQDSSCSTVLGLLSDFPFYDAPNVFCWWKVWTAGRPVSAPRLFSCEAMLLWWMQYVVSYCLAEICKVFPERRVIWMEADVALNALISSSALMEPFQMCKLVYTIPSETQAFNCSLMDGWSLFFCPQDTVSPKRISNFDWSDHRTVFHFASEHFRWALAQRRHQWQFSHMSSSLHDAALTCICELHYELCSQTVISDSVPELLQWCPVENRAWF